MQNQLQAQQEDHNTEHEKVRDELTQVKTTLYQSQQYASSIEKEKQTLIQQTNQLQSNIQNLQQCSINLQSQLAVTK